MVQACIVNCKTVDRDTYFDKYKIKKNINKYSDVCLFESKNERNLKIALQ